MRKPTQIRKKASAVGLAVAAALAGSITTSRTAMFSSAADDDPAAGTSELGGFLPIQEDELEMELAAFEEPEFLEDVPVGEGDVSDEVEEVLYGDEIIEELGAFQIPRVAIEAYNDAADVQEEADPQCGIRWSLLAAIGSVESGHGTFGGAKLREDGYGTQPIRGIPLDGRPNVALIRDTDNGELDGDTTYDRAVGPMQFIPSTWRSVGQDGNDDGKSDPNNIFDATQGAGAYLCAGDADLDDTAARARAVRRYNNADEYVRVVLRLAMLYETGRVEPLPDVAVPPAVATPSAPRPQPPPAPPRPRPGRPRPPHLRRRRRRRPLRLPPRRPPRSRRPPRPRSRPNRPPRRSRPRTIPTSRRIPRSPPTPTSRSRSRPPRSAGLRPCGRSWWGSSPPTSACRCPPTAPRRRPPQSSPAPRPAPTPTRTPTLPSPRTPPRSPPGRSAATAASPSDPKSPAAADHPFPRQ